MAVCPVSWIFFVFRLCSGMLPCIRSVHVLFVPNCKRPCRLLTDSARRDVVNNQQQLPSIEHLVRKNILSHSYDYLPSS
jgi:hypothetical protein